MRDRLLPTFLFCAFVLALIVIFPRNTVYAQTATPTVTDTPTPSSTPAVYLTIDPEEKTVQAGQTLSLTVKMHPVDSAVTVQSVGLRIGFSTSRLQYQSYTVPSDSFYESSEWDDQSNSPNTNGYVAFSASSTGGQSLTNETDLITIKFKALRAGSASVDYQFNDSASGYTVVISDTPEVSIVDQDQTVGGTYTITAPPTGNLPSAGIFDNALLLVIVGTGLIGAGAISFYNQNRFERAVTQSYLE